MSALTAALSRTLAAGHPRPHRRRPGAARPGSALLRRGVREGAGYQRDKST